MLHTKGVASSFNIMKHVAKDVATISMLKATTMSQTLHTHGAIVMHTWRNHCTHLTQVQDGLKLFQNVQEG